MKAVLAAIVLVALGLAAWLLARGDDGGETPDDGARAPESPWTPAPLLEPARERGATRDEPSARPREEGGPGPALPGALPRGPRISGRVEHAETGEAVPDAAVWAEASEEGCPRLPGEAHSLLARVGEALRRGLGTLGRSDERGAFEVALEEGAPATADLFVERAGFVPAVACGATAGSPVTVRLVPAVEVSGVVVSTDGRPVHDATVASAPAPGETEVLGAHAQAVTDAEGKFTLDGLARARVVVTADHPRHVPAQTEPVEPGLAREVRIVLVPAFLATFRVRTGDGLEAKTPSVSWRATGRGRPPVEDVALLSRARTPEEGDPEARGADPFVEHDPVKVPSDRAEVVFEVKAEGYAPWTSPPEPLPPGGGEKTWEVTLERDLSVGGLKVVLEDRDGRRLSWSEVGAHARFARRDALEVPGGIVMRAAEHLVVPALPAGPWQVWVRAPAYAPRSMPVEVVPGRETEARAVLGPPARLRVRFTAPEATVVRFRVFAGDEPAFPFVEGATSGAGAGTDDVPDLHAGAEGALLSGLGAGPHSVVVVSDAHVAPRTTVHLVEGETRDVEVAVSFR
jgi:hypothetical protein